MVNLFEHYQCSRIVVIVQQAFATFWAPTVYRWYENNVSIKKYEMVENSFVLLNEVVLSEALCIMENEGALYVGQSDGFVVVNFDSSTTTNFPTDSKVDRMVVDGDVLFVVSGNQLMMYDVSDPFTPDLIDAKSFGSDPLNCKGVAAD